MILETNNDCHWATMVVIIMIIIGVLVQFMLSALNKPIQDQPIYTQQRLCIDLF